MAFGYNGKGKRHSQVNKLITSPKQVKLRVTRNVLKNCIIANGYNCIDNDAEEIIFTQVSFCGDFTHIAAPKNKLIVFEDCTFHGKINFYGNGTSGIVLRDCRLEGKVHVATAKNQEPILINCRSLDGSRYTSFITDMNMQDESLCN